MERSMYERLVGERDELVKIQGTGDKKLNGMVEEKLGEIRRMLKDAHRELVTKWKNNGRSNV